MKHIVFIHFCVIIHFMFKKIFRWFFPLLSLTSVVLPTMYAVSCSTEDKGYSTDSTKAFEKIYYFSNDDVDASGKLKKATVQTIRESGYDGFSNRNLDGTKGITTYIDVSNFFSAVGTSTTSGFWSAESGVGEQVKYIAPYAFWQLGLKSIPTIPERIERIYEYAYYDNDFTSVTFESKDDSSKTQLRYIGRKSFQFNRIYSLNQVLPANLIEIDEEAFSHNEIASYLYLPDSLKYIRERAFFNNKINRLYLGKKLLEVEESAFDQLKEAGKVGTSIYRIKIMNSKTRFMGQSKNSACFTAGLKRVFNKTWTSYNWNASNIVKTKTTDGSTTIKAVGDERYNIAFVLEEDWEDIKRDEWW